MILVTDFSINSKVIYGFIFWYFGWLILLYYQTLLLKMIITVQNEVAIDKTMSKIMSEFTLHYLSPLSTIKLFY